MSVVTLMILFLVFMIGGIVLGLPIAFSLILSASGTALFMGGSATNPQIVAAQLMRGIDSVSMMALPFVVAGELMNRGGLTKRLIDFCNLFVGRVRGGLGYVVIFACLMFAALVGSAVASTAALGAILIPMMVDGGYNRAKSAGLVADAVPTILIMCPIMLPLIRAAGIDVVYFGIVFTLTNVLGLVTPPVGPVLNVACATGKVKMEEILPPVIPYFIAQVILVLALIASPQLITVPLHWMTGR